MEPTRATIKRLFALSANKCAFTDCDLPIVEETCTVTGITCHIKARNSGGPRYDPKQTDKERHAFENLILMCARHGALIDSEPERYPVEILQDLKAKHERRHSKEIFAANPSDIENLVKAYRVVYIAGARNVTITSPGVVHAPSVTFKTTRSKVKFAAPEGTLGSNAVRRNYVKHLIDRYNEFASKQTRATGFAFAAIYGLIKKEFKSHWETIPLTRFDDLVEFLHRRIDRTQLGSINRGKGRKNYSTFEEYRTEYAGEN